LAPSPPSAIKGKLDLYHKDKKDYEGGSAAVSGEGGVLEPNKTTAKGMGRFQYIPSTVIPMTFSNFFLYPFAGEKNTDLFPETASSSYRPDARRV
jgi:hypothetical protein